MNTVDGATIDTRKPLLLPFDPGMAGEFDWCRADADWLVRDLTPAANPATTTAASVFTAERRSSCTFHIKRDVEIRTHVSYVCSLKSSAFVTQAVGRWLSFR